LKEKEKIGSALEGPILGSGEDETSTGSRREMRQENCPSCKKSLKELLKREAARSSFEYLIPSLAEIVSMSFVRRDFESILILPISRWVARKRNSPLTGNIAGEGEDSRLEAISFSDTREGEVLLELLVLVLGPKYFNP
jgi:hypothetical protein